MIQACGRIQVGLLHCTAHGAAFEEDSKITTGAE